MSIKSVMAAGAVAGTVGLAMLATQAPAFAADDSMDLPGEFSGNVTMATDYRYRGFTQTDNEPTIQGGFDWAHDSGVYLGTWGSNVEFNDAHIELDFYGGYANEIGGFSYDLGAVYYWYPGATKALDFDFWEGYLGVGYDFDVVSVSGNLAYSPDFFGGAGNALYMGAGLSVPLPADISLDFAAGIQTLENTEPVYDWSIGVAKSMWGFDFSLAYIDTDQPGSVAGANATVVFAVSRSF